MRVKFTIAAAVLLAGAAHAEVSADGRRLQALDRLKVGVALCGITLPPATAQRLEAAYAEVGERQRDFTKRQNDAALKTLGEQMAADKATACRELTARPVDQAITSILADGH